MPAWLIALLPKLPETIWHALKRFASVALVAFLVLIPFIALKQYGDRHERRGYQAGYSQAIKDNPSQTYGTVGTVVNTPEIQKTLLDLGIFNFRFGAYWRK